MESISASEPVIISGNARSSPAPESFGQAWQREINGRATDGAAAREPGGDADTADGTNSTQSIAARAKGSAEEDTDRPAEGNALADGAANAAVAEGTAKPAPEAAAGSGSRAVGRLDVEANRSSARAPDGPILSSKTKTKAKQGAVGPRPGDAAEEANPRVAAAPVVVGIPATGILDFPPPAAIRVDTTGGAEAVASRPTKVASSGMKRNRPSIAGAVEKNAVLKAAPVANGGAGAVAGKEAKAPVTLSPGGQPGYSDSAGAQGANASGHHANPDGAQLTSAVSHLNAAAAMDVGARTSAPAHGPAIPSGAEMRLHAATSVTGDVAKGHEILAAGPARLDIGVFDGTHGWLRIRAELGTGGAVSASLTSSASAHESLRAAVPEMANYLQSEAVSVSRIEVHRVTESPGAMAPGFGGSEDKAGAEGHRERGQESRNDGSRLSQDSPSGNGDGTGAAFGRTIAATGEWTSAATGPKDWFGGISRSMPRFGPAFGAWGGGSGGWLSVQA